LADCAVVLSETRGFPFSYVESAAQAAGSTFDVGSFAANWLVWAVIAVVSFFVLRWAWDKFSRLVFYTVIAAVAASYFGIITFF